MADYGLWQGLEKATGNMAATGMNLMNYQAQRQEQAERMGLARDQLKIAQEAAAREKTAFEHAERKRLEQEAQENAFVAFSSIAPKIHETPRLKSMMMETAKSAGFDVRETPDKEIYIPVKGINFLKNLMGTQADFQKKALDATLADLSDRSVSISQKIAELQESGKMDEKTLAPLIQQRDAIKTQIAGILTADVALQKQLAIEQAKKTGSGPKVVGNYLVDDKGNVIFKGTQDKQVERTVDLGDRVEYIYADGKREIKPKGVSPAKPVDQIDRTLISKTLTEIPKLKADAITQVNNIERINRALSLVETGVTGKGGQVKAFLAPYAEMIGVPSQNMDDSQLFQMLTRVIVGPMRLDIIGPGPVSEWEQKLMQQISGGGGAAKTAARELLGYYKKQAAAKVDNYNATLEGLSSIYPRVSEIHKPVGKKSAGPQPGTAGTPKKVGRFTVEVE